MTEISCKSIGVSDLVETVEILAEYPTIRLLAEKGSVDPVLAKSFLCSLYTYERRPRPEDIISYKVTQISSSFKITVEISRASEILLRFILDHVDHVTVLEIRREESDIDIYCSRCHKALRIPHKILAFSS